MLAPERRTRADVLAAFSIALVIIVAVTVVWLRSDARGAISVTADTTLPPLATSMALPAALEKIWEAPSAQSPAPITVGNAVVTADGSDVIGRDPATGDEVWRYSRNIPLCGAIGAFDRVVAVYQDDRGCSQVTSLVADTGYRKDQRSSDADDAVTLSTDGTHLVSLGDSRMELWRSDLVRTLEYGRVDAPVNPNKQPWAGCELLDAASSSSRVSVLQTCPGDASNRLTVLDPSPKDSQEPQEFGSVVLPDSVGAHIVAVSGEKTALFLPAGDGTVSRIAVFDGVGTALVSYPVSGTVSELETTQSDQNLITWWNGTQTLKLNTTDLSVTWILSGTSGPGRMVAGQLLVPVPSGIAVINPEDGSVKRMISVDRGEVTTPVLLAGAGDTLIEQYNGNVVAVR